MNGCNAKILDKYDPCEPGPARVASNQIEQLNARQLRATKVIYNYKDKTEKQIQASVQLEIDQIVLRNPAYRFVNSKSHFNGNGGIEMELNFELK